MLLIMHVVLLGDSSFDNAAFVGEGGLSVVRHLRARLPSPWQASLRARDGAGLRDVPFQLQQAPNDATHLAVSAGGNDARAVVGVLGERVQSVVEALMRFHEIRETFAARYCEMLDAVLMRGLPVGVCTIYDPAPTDVTRRCVMSVGLQTFNDVITRAAFERGLPLVDLRLTCNEPVDLANPIEPSSVGGAKIADGIAQLVTWHDFGCPRSTVYIGRNPRSA